MYKYFVSPVAAPTDRAAQRITERIGRVAMMRADERQEISAHRSANISGSAA